MFHVRLATPADYATFARLYPELDAGEPLATDAEFVASMLPRVLILEDEVERGVGYAFWRTYGEACHVVHVVVDRAARGKRGGELLLNEVRERARKQGCSRLFLNVRKNNEAAIRLYTRAGLHVKQEGWSICIEWENVLSLEGEDATPLAVLPEHDEAIAARFGINRERVALLRSKKDVVLVALRDHDGAIAAFGAFEPHVPGIYPIGVARLTLAGALFRAIHSHAKHIWFRVFVEADRALAECLLSRGGVLELELFRMVQDL